MSLGLGLKRLGITNGATSVVKKDYSAYRVAEVNGRSGRDDFINVNDSMAFRLPFVIGTDLNILSLAFFNFTGDVTSGVSSIIDTDPWTIKSCSIEDALGNVALVKFDGQREKLIPAGARFVPCDDVKPTDFNPLFVKLNRADTYWVKFIVWQSATNMKFPASSKREDMVAGAQCKRYNRASTTPSSADAAGVFTFTGTAPNTTVNGICPIAIGVYTDPSVRAWLVDGTSLEWGAADYSSGTTPTAGVQGHGWVSRAMYNGGADVFPCLNIGVSSSNSDMLTNYSQWEVWLPFIDDVIDCHAINDKAVAGKTFAQIQTDLLRLWAKFAGKDIYKTEAMPYCPGAGTYLDDASQTIGSGWASGEMADQLNDWYKTKEDEGVIKRVFSSWDTVSPTNHNKWFGDGVTANLVAADGVHYSPNGADRISKRRRLGLLAARGEILAWFDSLDQRRMTKAGNYETSGLLQVWQDKGSSKSYTARQATSGNRATYGQTSMAALRPGVTFAAASSQQYVLDNEIPYADGYSIFFVIKPSSDGTNRYILGNPVANAIVLSLNVGNKLVLAKFSGATLATSVTSLTAGNTYFCEVRTTGAGAGTGVEILINEVSDVTAATAPAFAAGIKYIGGRGGTLCCDGVMGEMVITKGNPRAATRASIIAAVKQSAGL